MTWVRTTFAGLGTAWRRAVEQRGILAAYAALAAVLAAAAAVAPLLMERASDAGLRHALSAAGPSTDLTLTYQYYFEGGTAPTFEDLADVGHLLPPHLARVAGKPGLAAAAESTGFAAGGKSFSVERVEVAHPPVRWVDGSAPGSYDPNRSGTYTVDVGLSVANARAMGVAAGAVLPPSDGVSLHVTGLFEPLDANDPAWRAAPSLLAFEPPFAPRPDVAALLGPAVLPKSDTPVVITTATHTLVARVPIRLAEVRSRDIDALLVDLARIKDRPGGLSTPNSTIMTTDTRLAEVLTTYQARVTVARAQLTTVLVGLTVGAGLVLALAASLLVSRRRTMLALERARGASVGSVAVRALAESAVVTVVAAGVGVLATLPFGGLVMGGDLVPAAVVLACVLLLPAFSAVRTAWASWSSRRVPTDRDARREKERVRRSWGVAAKVGVVALAAAALAAARVRGFDRHGDLFTQAAPVLVGAACCVLVLWLVPWLVRSVVRRRARRWSAITLVSATRAASGGAGTTALLSVAVVATLAVFSAAQASTVAAAQQRSTDAVVGAAVRVDNPDDGYVDWIKAQFPGIKVAPASVLADRSLGTGTGLTVTVLAVDTATFPQLAALAHHAPLHPGDRVPALVDAGLVHPIKALDPSVLAIGASMKLDVVGTADLARTGPPVSLTDPSAEPVIVVDRDAMVQATGTDATRVATDIVWLDGPGAEKAAAVNPGSLAVVTVRSALEASLRTDPLLGGVTALLRLAALALAALAAAAVGLTVLAGGPERLRVLAVLRTLGVPRRAGRSLAIGELAPMLAAAVVSGALAGALVAWLLTGVQGLELLANGTAAALALPWWPFVLVPAAVAAALVVGAWLEERGRRHARVGETLRTY